MRSLTLLLSDARFPSGGHAHSGGIEEACAEGTLDDLAGLDDFLRGRLATSGKVAAHIAAAVCSHARDAGDLRRVWRVADLECDARTPSPAARSVSRRQGGPLLRTALRVFDTEVLRSLLADSTTTGMDPHQPVATGAVAAAGRLSPLEAAAACAYGAVAGPASAALRLLGLDPAGVAKVLVGISGEVDSIAIDAARTADRPLSRLPSPSAPILDLLGEAHFERKERLFAS